MHEPNALTPRAIATGLCAGALLALGNLTVGLATGIWDSGQITASLLAFALASALPAGRGRFTPLENDAAQVLACAAAAMPAAMGLLGALPALQQLGLDLRANGLVLLTLGTSLALLGAGLAFLLAPRLLDEEKLPFPTGIATAELIGALHGNGDEARQRTRALLLAGAAALAIVWLRDPHPTLAGTGWNLHGAWADGVVPAALFLPLALGEVDGAALGLGVGVSPLLWGVGIVVGVRTGISLALGALFAWALGGPLLLSRGLVAQPDQLGTWLVWPGVAILVGASAIDLAAQARSLLRSLADLSGAARTGFARFSGPALALALLVLVSAHQAMGLSYLAGLVSLLLFAPLCATAPADVGAGAIVAGGAAEAATVLWSLRAGRILGAARFTQARSAVIGIVFGALFSLPAYLLLVRSAPIGSARNPAPSAAQWRAIAELVTHGTRVLPPGALAASLCAVLLGALLALGSRGPGARFLPSPIALGIGFLIPAAASTAVLAGGLLALVIGRLLPARASALPPSIAAGLIAGESLLSFALAALGALGLFH